MPSEPARRCHLCGAAAIATLREGTDREPICLSCLDRNLPTILPGDLIRLTSRLRRQDGKCPHCGWTEAQLQETALVGCPLCYEALNVAPTIG